MSIKANHAIHSATFAGSRVLLLFFFLFFSLLTQAAPVLVIDQKFQQTRLDSVLDIVDNVEQEINRDNVLTANYQNQFAPLPIYMPSALSHYSNKVWLRFVLRNVEEVDHLLWFAADDGLARGVKIYRVDGGALVPLNEAVLFKKGYTPLLKEIALPAGEEQTILVEVDNIALNALQLHLAKPEVFFQTSLLQRQYFSFGIGIMVANALMCLVFAVYFTAPFFFWQMFYVAAVASVMMFGLYIPSGWVSHFSDGQFLFAFCATAVACLSALMATNAYLAEVGLEKMIRRYVVGIVLLAAAGFAVLVMTGNGYTPLLLVLVACVSIVILSVGIYGWAKSGEKLVLWATLVRGANGIVIVYLLASQTWFFIELLNPAILFCMVIETAILTLIYLLHMYQRKTLLLHNQQLMAVANSDAATRSELIKEISHDIRTPLSAIIGVASLLKNTALTESQQEKIDVIGQSAQELIAYLASQQARIQLDELDQAVRPVPFEIAQLIDVCMQAYQLQAERQEVELIVSFAADVPSVVSGDSTRLHKIFMNILSCLLRHSKQCDVLIKVSRAKVSGEHLLFSFNANCGKSNELMDVIGEQEIRTVQQLLVSMQSGLNISASDEAQEFRFELLLPALNEVLEDDDKTHQLLQRKRVLVVDDNHTYCKVLKQQLSVWGLQASEAYDGEQAIAMVRTAKTLGNAFDLVIIDYDMPQLSGLEVAAKIHHSADAPMMIMLTGAGTMPSESALHDVGIAAVLHKPASQKLLRLTLANLLLHKTRQGQTQAQYRVLVAEDNDVSRRVISKMLDSAAVRYKLVSNGQMALEAVQREKFDLIFMDCEMPLMDGFEASRAIHAWQRASDKNLTPIVALTAHTLGTQQELCREAGMVDFMAKPVTLAALQAMIFKYCERR